MATSANSFCCTDVNGLRGLTRCSTWSPTCCASRWLHFDKCDTSATRFLRPRWGTAFRAQSRAWLPWVGELPETRPDNLIDVAQVLPNSTTLCCDCYSSCTRLMRVRFLQHSGYGFIPALRGQGPPEQRHEVTLRALRRCACKWDSIVPEALVGPSIHFSGAHHPRELVLSLLQPLCNTWCIVARLGNPVLVRVRLPRGHGFFAARLKEIALRHVVCVCCAVVR